MRDIFANKTKKVTNFLLKKPAGGEVSAETNGAYTAYKISDKVWISVANVHGGGRMWMGQRFTLETTTDDVAVAVARVARDGPVSFPDTMFANQLFRESIQALEALGRISVEPGSNSREKTIYELGPDGKPRQPPAAPKPLSVSPKLTTYKPEDPAALPEFKPAKSHAEAHARLSQYLYEGGKVDYGGVHVDRMNSLLKATDHVLGKYGVPVAQFGFCSKSGANYGRCAYSGNKVLYVQVRKSYVKDPESYKKRDIGRMRANQAYEILRTEKYIGSLKSGEGFKDRPGQEGAVERELHRNEKKLEHLKAVDHWIVADAVDDPLYATQVHECWHAVYAHHNIGAKWTEEMDKVSGWSIPLTEYATENKREFFAELGAAVTCGMKVHPKLMEAFKNTVGSIKV